jgi:hypothetical protein
MGKRTIIVLILVFMLTPISFVSADPNGVEKTGVTTAIEMEWNSTFGGISDDWAHSIIHTTDGGYALAGITESYGAGDMDMWLVKTDANGQAEWNNTFGGNGIDVAFSMIHTADGGFALVGFTESYGASGRYFWLVKTDINGQHEWNNTYGGIDNELCRSIVQTTDGGFALAGETHSFGAGIYDMWLIKTDVNGQLEWNNTFGGTNWESAASVIQTADGGYVLAGHTFSYGAGDADFWLVKTNASGQPEWDNTYGGTKDDRAMEVIQTVDGGFVLVGNTKSFSAGSYDMWLVKTDANGQLEWNNSFGGIESDGSNSVTQTADGGFIITGYTASYGAGGVDIWLVKTNASGQLEWKQTFGGSADDYDTRITFGYQRHSNTLIQLSDGNFVLAGGTRSYGAGGADFWLIKTMESEGTTTTTASTSFPSPFIIFSFGVLIIKWRKREK